MTSSKTPLHTPASTGADGRRSQVALWSLVSVLAGNMLLDALEVSATLVALPAIGNDLNLPLSRLQWTVSGFAAGFGGLLFFGGRLVALLGRRPVYLAALLVFAAASLAGALANSLELLIATRVVKGFCVALTAPTGLAIIASVFPQGPARRRALSVYSLFGALGFCAGLLLSGLLTPVSWRLTFAFPAPVALSLFVAALFLVPRDGPAKDAPQGYGAAPALSLTGTALLVVYAVVSATTTGGNPMRTVGAFALAALLAAVFVRTEPALRMMLPPRRGLPRPVPLLRSALGAAALNGSYLGFLLVSTLHLQQRAGWSPSGTALAFLPASAPLALTVLHSGRLVARIGTARAITAGAAAATLGYALYPREAAADVRYATDVLPTMLLVGAAFVLAFTALHLQATASAPVGRQQEAGEFYQTCVQMGAVLVIALTSALHTAAGHGPALWLVTAVGLAGWLLALHALPTRRTVHATAR